MKRLLVFLLLFGVSLAYPSCYNSTVGTMNITVTNSTPVLEVMTIDIVTSQAMSTECYIRIYDNHTCLVDLKPRLRKSVDVEPSFIESLIGSYNDLVVSNAGTVHKDVWVDPSLFRSGYPYTVYVECGLACDSTTVYFDNARVIPLERLTENWVYPVINYPSYVLGGIVSLVIGIFLFKLFLKLITG